VPRLAKAEQDQLGAAKLVADTEVEVNRARTAHEKKLAAEVEAHEKKMKKTEDELNARVKAFEAERAALAREEAGMKARARTLRESLDQARL
jgi:hypothetical protein